jgi:hypothetical protein
MSTNRYSQPTSLAVVTVGNLKKCDAYHVIMIFDCFKIIQKLKLKVKIGKNLNQDTEFIN